MTAGARERSVPKACVRSTVWPPQRRAPCGALRKDDRRGRVARRSVKDEIRDNLIAKAARERDAVSRHHRLRRTVVPQIVNAVLSRHNFILLGLRGQAKSRILRALTMLLDERMPVDAGLRDPRRPAGAALRRVPGARARGRRRPADRAGSTRDARYVEKLATPDVTIADMIGDLDPIKAARAGLQLSDELTMHYGLLPRANRGIFAINELPDLAGKIQVGLFNILQEGDVQIKGYPVRLPLDVMLVFTREPGGLHGARQDHHAAQGPHRIRDPHALSRDAPARDGDHRAGSVDRRAGSRARSHVPEFVREVVEEVAFQARADRQDRQAVGRQPAAADLPARERGLERRAPRAGTGESAVVPRVTDIYAALPAITGKFELEYEGELQGRRQRRPRSDPSGGRHHLQRLVPQRRSPAGHRMVRPRRQRSRSTTRCLRKICWRTTEQVQGLHELARQAGAGSVQPDGAPAAAIDFVLEGLYAQRKIAAPRRASSRRAEQGKRAPRMAVDP